ncbi:MAG: hypothetical protein R3E02_16315 [Blastomonas sp.]
MKRMTLPVAILSLALAACGEGERITEDSPAAEPAGERLGAPDDAIGARPVRIGEGGPRFDACQAVGRIRGLGGRTLDLHDAPDDRAASIANLAEGDRLWICTRSIDQQWLGVVLESESVAEADGSQEAPPPVDCGVSSPVRSKRSYDGPCTSGWVESNFVQLIAG